MTTKHKVKKSGMLKRSTVDQMREDSEVEVLGVSAVNFKISSSCVRVEWLEWQ